MNFLAHLHLSYPNTPEMVGNFIGDYVKGNKYKLYPQEIAQGIELHRKIDTFTDAHPLQIKCRKHFSKPYRLYAGIINDMLFDYFLAKHWNDYSELSLIAFEKEVYQSLEAYYLQLPPRVQGFLPKMKASQRLQSYATLDGIAEALNIMTHYTSLPNHTSQAITIIEDNEVVMRSHFTTFYDELIAYVKDERINIQFERTSL